MSQEAKVQLSVLGIVLLVGTVAGLVLFSPIPDPQAQAAPTLVVIDPSKVVLYAPTSGRRVDVFVGSTALQNADNQTVLRAHNVATGEWGTPQNFNDVSGTWLSIYGGGGDLVELEADNGSVTVETIDFIPNPTDIARPDFDPDNLTPAFSGGTFTLTAASGKAVDDEHFPISLVATVSSSSATDSQTLTNVYSPVSLSLAATASARVTVVATDDFGNRSELHYRADGTVPAASGLSSFSPSADQVDAERTGLAPRAGQGVLLVGREFSTTVNVAGHAGAVLPVNIPITYRSGLVPVGNEFDGPVGMGWDFSLDSRIGVSGTSRIWYPGDGREETGFTPDGSHKWDSPPGIFRRLTYDKTVGEYSLTSKNGSKLVFSGSQRLLSAQVDVYGNRIDYIRNALRQVVEIQDDRGRRTLLGWFDTGRLAVVEDYSGQRTYLNYDSSRRLTSAELPDGSTRSWNYDSSQTYLLTEVVDGGARVALKNIYGTAGNDARRVIEQRDRASSGTTGWAFAADTAGCLVTDPLGAEVIYGFDTQSSAVHLSSIEWRSNLDLRTPPVPPPTNWPDNDEDDPYAWRTVFTINAQNLLLHKRYNETVATMGATPVSHLEEEWWEYETPNDPEPTLRARPKVHRLYGNFTDILDDLTETWLYGSTDKWPTTYRGFSYPDTAEVALTYDDGGQVETRLQAGIQRAVQTGTYDIAEKYEYDSKGRLTASWNANRLFYHGGFPSAVANTVRTYHASGLQEGWLATHTVQDASGTSVLSTAYTYDTLGRLASRTDPDSSVWTWEYDELGRRVRALEPVVTMNDPNATISTAQGEREWVYESGSGDLEKVRTKNILSTGVVATTPWVETRYDYTSAGLQYAVERDIDASSASRSEVRFNARGDVVVRGERATGTLWSVVTSEWDERGLLLRTSALVDHESDLDLLTGTSAIEDWYQYDIPETLTPGSFQGRSDHHYGHEWTDSDRTFHDAFGRVAEKTSTVVNLGKETPTSSESDGQFLTTYVFDDLGRMEVEEKFSKQDQGSWVSSSRTRLDYDEANRTIRTWRARVSSATTPTVEGSDWAANQTDFRPGGEAERSYGPDDEANSVYSATTYDELDRTLARTTPHGDKTENLYSGPGGRLSETTTIPFDDGTGLVSSSEDYHTTFEYDALGRMTLRTEKGQDSGNDHFRVVRSYNSLGQNVRVAHQIGLPTTSYTTTRVVRRTHDFHGKKLSSTRGATNIDTGGAGRYEKDAWEYDLSGRLVSKTQHGDDALTQRDWAYTYDGLGRLLTETLPSRGSSAPTRTNTYTYTFSGAQLTTSLNDANGVTINTTVNEVGRPVLEWVGTTNQPEGNENVEFYYGENGGCGCSGLGNVTEVRTNGPLVADTKVSRAYNYSGELESETIAITDEPLTTTCPLSLTTQFEYDIAGRRTVLEYPDVQDPTASPALTMGGAEEERVYTASGMLDRIDWDPVDTDPLIGSPVTLMDFQYRGARKKQVRTYFSDGSAQLTGTYTWDAHGRQSTETWVETTGSVHVMRQEHDWRSDGQLTRRMQPNDQATGGELWQHYFYDPSTQWLEGFTWDDDGTTVRGGADYKERTIGRSVYGEVDLLTDERLENQGSLINDWAIHRDDAGFADPTYTSQTYSQDPRVFEYKEPPLSGAKVTLSNRTTNIDQLGRRTSTEFDLATVENCGTEHSKWDFERDAWGRVHSSRLERECSTGASCLSTDPPCLTTIEYLYDGFGRKIRRCVTTNDQRDMGLAPTQYYAYEGMNRITTVDRDGCDSCDILNVREGMGDFPDQEKQ